KLERAAERLVLANLRQRLFDLYGVISRGERGKASLKKLNLTAEICHCSFVLSSAVFPQPLDSPGRVLTGVQSLLKGFAKPCHIGRRLKNLRGVGRQLLQIDVRVP